MAKYGKWIGAGLGLALGGPLGALFGLFIGSMFDNIQTIAIPSDGGPIPPGQTGRGDVKTFLIRNFGIEATREAMQMIKELSTRDIPVDDVCQQIRFQMPEASKVQLLYFLFGIAKADGTVSTAEIGLLENISNRLGIDHVTFMSVKSMYYDDIESAYQVLGIDSSASNEEIKKAYRKIAMENHPDKVGHLGEDIRKAAEEKFSRINVAYEKIKKQRGMN